MRKLLVPSLAALAFAMALTGCHKADDSTAAASGGATASTSAPATGAAAGGVSDVKIDADAGVPLTTTADDKQLKNLEASNAATPRSDPFALTAVEKKFDTSQASERLDSQNGAFEFMYEVPEPKDETPPVEEPQPYRRLSGVLVGDSVLAIIEMGDGRTSPEIVRPGQYIPNSEWKVISIDEEKAVLRRAGNVNPKEIVVRLEQRPPGMSNGAPGGGFPGGAGPGRRGGPGGAPGMPSPGGPAGGPSGGE